MEPLNPRTIRRLLMQPESTTLDFKREPYALKKAKEVARAAMIKDILAFANTLRDADAFILLGIAERSDGTPEIIGVSEHLDGEEIQQIVNEKTNRPINFRYEKVAYEGVELGVIRIERVQPRPLYLRRDYEQLRANAVFIRRDSTTDMATPDEILQMRRVPVAVTDARRAHPGLRQMAERWLTVFDNHDVRRSQIATVLQHPELCSAHFHSWETLLPIMTDDLIDATCRVFNVDRAWLDGDSDEPFTPVYTDGHLSRILDAMVQMRLRSNEAWVLGLKSHRRELHEHPSQLTGVLLCADVMVLNNRPIVCYQPIATGPFWNWSNKRCRWDLKKIFLAARYLGMYFDGYTLPAERITKLSEGESFPKLELRPRSHPRWHPDDYIYPPEESLVAKDSADLSALLVACKKDGFLDRLRVARRSIPDLRGDDPEVIHRPRS